MTALVSWLSTLLATLDATNGADVNFLLGTWLSDAAQWAFNASEATNRAFNARNQVTLWGDGGRHTQWCACQLDCLL